MPSAILSDGETIYECGVPFFKEERPAMDPDVIAASLPAATRGPTLPSLLISRACLWTSKNLTRRVQAGPVADCNAAIDV